MTLSDHGTPELQTRGNKIEISAEATVGGATCMVDRWHTYADFLRDLNLITQDHHDAFSEFLELWHGAHAFGHGNGNGKGEKYQDWITFGARLGSDNLRIINFIRESDPPSSSYQCASALDVAKKALANFLDASNESGQVQMRSEVDRLQNALKMRESIIESHRLSAILMRKNLHAALAMAQRTFKVMLDEKRQKDL